MLTILKPSEGWDIRLKKKISESIQIKTFLSMLALLIVSCVLIYGLVMFFLPRNYHAELQSQVTADFYELVDIIEQNGWESSTNSILEFALKNNASVTVTDGAGESVFSVNSVNLASTENVVPATDSTPSMSCSSTFQDNGQSYQLYANIALIAVSQSYGILLQLLPLIVGIILVVSVLGAMICSRYYSKPLVSIIITANDEVYQNISSALSDTGTLITTLIVVITAVSMVLIILILSMSIRSRKRETGILLAVGIAKPAVILQYVLETLLIAVVAFPLAYLSSKQVAGTLGTLFGKAAENVIVTPEHFMLVAIVGGILLVAAVLVSSISTMRLKPKQILSQME